MIYTVFKNIFVGTMTKLQSVNLASYNKWYFFYNFIMHYQTVLFVNTIALI